MYHHGFGRVARLDIGYNPRMVHLTVSGYFFNVQWLSSNLVIFVIGHGTILYVTLNGANRCILMI
jgi:hypothetical protein